MTESSITNNLKDFQKKSIDKMRMREVTFYNPVPHSIADQKAHNSVTVHTNVGILSNKIDSGKVSIVCGLISECRNVVPYTTVDPFRNLIYNSSPKYFSRDVTNIIADYANGIDTQIMTYARKDLLSVNILSNVNNASNFNDIHISSNLIIVHHSVFFQWKLQISKTNLSAKYICNKSDIDFTKEDVSRGYLSQYDIVLCSVTKIRQLYDISFLKYVNQWYSGNADYVWSRVFIDDATIIAKKIAFFPPVRAHYQWFITNDNRDLVPIARCMEKKNFIFKIFGRVSRFFKKYKKQLLLDTFTVQELEEDIFKELSLPDYIETKHVFPDPFPHQFLCHEGNFYVSQAVNNYDIEQACFLLSKKTTYAALMNVGLPLICDYNESAWRQALNKKNILLLLICLYAKKVKQIRFSRIKTQKVITANWKRARSMDRSISILKHFEKIITTNKICTLCHSVCYLSPGNLACASCCTKLSCSQFNFNVLYKFCIEWKEKYNVRRRCCVQSYGEMTIPRIKNFSKKSCKIQWVINKLLSQEYCEKRTIVFVSSSFVLSKIKKELDDNECCYTVIKGNSQTINRRVQDFNEGAIKILIMSELFFVASINLRKTDSIFILNNISIKTKERLISKAQRVGRTKPLNVYFLLHANELDTVI